MLESTFQNFMKKSVFKDCKKPIYFYEDWFESPRGNLTSGFL